MYRHLKNIVFLGLFIILNPKLLLLIFKSIYIPSYVQFEWLKKYKIKTVVDVGAYQGNVLKALHYLLPRAELHAFEPLEDNFKVLSSRFSTTKKVYLNKVALSNKQGNAKFYKNKILPASSLLPISPFGKKTYKFLSKETLNEVLTTTLDKYFTNKKIEKHVFLKIDTQGSEYLVLKGGKKFLHNVSILYIESSFGELYEGQCSFNDLYQFLLRLKFRYIGGSTADYGFYPFFNLPRSENSIFVNTTLLNL